MERLLARKLVRCYTLSSCLPARQSRDLNAQAQLRLFSCHTQPMLDSNKGFIGRFVDNLRSEMFKNKEIKENLDKFRQEREKLDDTEAIKQARQKFKQVEEESLREANEVLQSAKDSIKKAAEADIVKKTILIGGKLSSQVSHAAGEISKQSEFIKETSAFKTVQQATKTVGKEIDEAEIISNLYTPPSVLCKRSDRATMKAREVAPNTEESTLDLHKDTRWAQSWNRFKDDNPYMNKVFEYKMKYDESDNPFVRLTRNFVERVGEITGNLFKKTDLSNVLTEICKVDPTFDINSFLHECEKFIVPTILEASLRNEAEILQDWCYETSFNVLSFAHTEAKKLNLRYKSKIIDLQNFDLFSGEIMEQGPVLLVTFQTQQITYVMDAKGNVVEGDPDSVISNQYVMAFCRDQSDLDPNTAWRLLDVRFAPID